ncbi:reverse transcriptase domain-containing protein [Tanacetum coccineum]
MSFGLRNAGATYQHLVDKAFHKQIGINLEVYVDELVIKSRTDDEITHSISQRADIGRLYSRTTRRGISGYSMGEEEELPEPWILFTDGSSCTDGSGAGLILTNPKGMKFTYALRFRFDATKNKAKYKALIARLKIAKQMGVKNLQANVDSRLVANQVNGTYVAKETDMALSKITSTSFAHLSKQVLVEELKEKSISVVEVLAVVKEEGDTWMTPIFKYLMDGTLPAEVKKARAVKRKSWRFSIINGTLYKKSFLGPWLRCVGPLQANYVLREIHEGSSNVNAGT